MTTRPGQGFVIFHENYTSKQKKLSFLLGDFSPNEMEVAG